MKSLKYRALSLSQLSTSYQHLWMCVSGCILPNAQKCVYMNRFAENQKASWDSAQIFCVSFTAW